MDITRWEGRIQPAVRSVAHGREEREHVQGNLISLPRVEEVLEGEATAEISLPTLNRLRLIDKATVLLLTIHGLEESIERYSEMAGTEQDAAEAKRMVRATKDSLLWLQVYSAVAAEDEVRRRVLAARRDAIHTLFLVRRMQHRHRQVWESLTRLLDGEPFA